MLRGFIAGYRSGEGQLTISACIRHGEYYDSVTLLEVAQKVLRLPGVVDAAVVMGTPANRGILANAELYDTACEAGHSRRPRARREGRGLMTPHRARQPSMLLRPRWWHHGHRRGRRGSDDQSVHDRLCCSATQGR